MRFSTRGLVMGIVSLAGLLLGYGVIFTFYAAGLLGDGTRVPAAHWEKTLKGTVLLGPFLGGFLLMGFLAWRQRWRAGVLPWAFGATGVMVLGRLDAGILKALDLVWLAVTLVLVFLMTREERDGEGES